MLRIIAGQYRGRLLDAPQGLDTRPTTDRVRESLVSSVLSLTGFEIDDLRVLDAFAGTGAFGLEMLSRGAAHCCFVEQDARAFKVLSANIEKCKIERGRFFARASDVFSLARRGFGVSFGLVFLDPPYSVSLEDVASLVSLLDGNGSLGERAIVIYEHATTAEEKANLPAIKRHEKVPPTQIEKSLSPTLELYSSKAFGKTTVSIFRKRK